MTHPISGFLDGLMGGVQAGTQFRQNRDLYRQAQTDRVGDQEYEQSRRLREQVGFEMQQRVMQAQLDKMGGPQYTEVSPGATLHDPTGRAPDYTAPGGVSERPLVQDWQKEGFPSQEAWAAYHLRISRAGNGADVRGQVTPRDIAEWRRSLMAPKTVFNPAKATFEEIPGKTFEEADRIVHQSIGDYQAPPAASRFGGGLVQPGTGGTAPRMPQGGRSAPMPPPAPTPQATTPQDRWEELVGQGMDKDAATAQVKQEFGIP